MRGLRRVEYDALVATGLLDGEPVELIEGALLRMSPQDAVHAKIIRRVARQLAPQLPQGWELTMQLPLAVSDDSEPEPDIAVVPVDDDPYTHATTAALVVEVARTSHRVDLQVKPQLYAAAGVPDYWVIDVTGRIVYAHDASGEVVQRAESGVLASTGPVRVALDVTALLDRL